VRLKLEITRLSKRYRGDVWGLRDVSLEVGPGILGLLGPNGAGKSTLMRLITTVTRPTEGEIRWNGKDITVDPDSIRRSLGYLPQDFGIYPQLNSLEFLTYLAAARGIGGRQAARRIRELLDLVNLGDAARRRLGRLSGGMRQRVGIAQALLNDPQLLVVDEPTAGLDPEERIRFRNLLTELAGDRIVILSSHIVSDVEAAAGAIAVLNRGRLLTCVAPEVLLREVEGKVWEVLVPSSQLADLRTKYEVSATVRSGDGVRARVVGSQPPPRDAAPLTPTLEDAYVFLLARSRNQGRHD
jgi:ABC-type multidrug transport system ATPase subunit